MKVYIATCLDRENNPATIRNTDYDELLEYADNFGYDIQEVTSMDWDDWIKSIEKEETKDVKN
jgi:hypothetical protein